MRDDGFADREKIAKIQRSSHRRNSPFHLPSSELTSSMRPPRAQPLLFHPRLQRLPCRQCLIFHLPLPLTARHNSSKPTEPPENLPSSTRSTITARAAEYIDTLQLRALAATQRLNDITGYTSIEALKTQIHTQGAPSPNPQSRTDRFLDAAARTAREAVVNAKQAYSSAVDTRAETQRELTNLLNRKTSWTPDDLARFTYLYPSDHENEQRVQRTAEQLSRAERESEEASAELGRLILSRYPIPYPRNELVL
jgi:sensitive to high expression protein 9